VPSRCVPTHTDHLGVAVWRTLNRTFKKPILHHLRPRPRRRPAHLRHPPIFGLSRRFRDYISFERQQMDHLALWLRTQHDDEDASALADLSSTIRFRQDLHTSRSPSQCWRSVRVPPDHAVLHSNLIRNTYEARSAAGSIKLAFILWNTLLCTAYFLHWIQIRSYVHDLSRFIEKFNRITSRDRLDPVNPPALSLGLRLGWIVTAIALVCVGALWGIPLALAGASQRALHQPHRRPRPRADGGARPRHDGLPRPCAARRNGYRVHGPRCDRDNCRARLPAGSRFCPRCGAPVTAPTDVHFDDSLGGPV
jgi:hypothetical protein